MAGLLVWLLVLRDGNDKGPVVPAVVGLPQQRAVGELTSRGFDVKVIVAPAKRPRGIVVSQIPGAGTRLGRGQTVTLHVSNGHALAAAPRVTTTATTASTTTAAKPAQATVPSVAGEDMASAAGQVEAAGFVAETDPVAGSGAPGTVTAQNPSASAQASTGGVVRLSVATGSSRR